MKFRHFVLLIVVLSIGFMLQQFNRYLTQWDALHALKTEAVQLSGQIENMMHKEESIRQQLQKAEQLSSKLRRLLPETLQQDEFEQLVAALAKKHRIKILATRTAINSRPGYREATLSITLEASATPAKRFMRELKSIPRRVHIVPPEKRGKKSIHLSILIYAVRRDAPAVFIPPVCIAMPSEVLLPPLRDRLSLLYADYSKQCRFVNSYAERYLEQLRLHALQKENTRLQAIEQQLRSRP